MDCRASLRDARNDPAINCGAKYFFEACISPKYYISASSIIALAMSWNEVRVLPLVLLARMEKM